MCPPCNGSNPPVIMTTVDTLFSGRIDTLNSRSIVLNILSPLFLFASLAMIYITTSSSSTGNVASSGTSCGSCHGSKNTATTVNLTGLPASYVPGQSYTLTFTVANATNAYAGCNIAASAGTFTAGTGTQLMGSQITHTAPKAAVSGVTTFTCSWTAPATAGSVTFNAAGNAVNFNNGDKDIKCEICLMSN